MAIDYFKVLFLYIVLTKLSIKAYNKDNCKGGIHMEQILKDRQIDWLMHFTQAENLPNIMEYGLMPRSELEFCEIDFSYNDDYRYDKCEDAVCASIEFPNYKMFYPLRCNNPDVDWAVLLLDSQIILDFDCAFCTTNAGNSNMFNMSITQRKGKRAFLKLFEELPNGPSRKELKIGDWYPTDPQSEVLVFDTILVQYIKSVFFNSQRIMENYMPYIPEEISCQVKHKVFSYRKDWEYWR